MSDYRILFLDIDGTILRRNDTIEDSTKEAIAQVREQEVEVVLATGRPLHEIGEIAEELKIDSFIGYNGAYAIYKGKNIFDEPMDASTVSDYLQIADEHHHEIILYTSTKNTFTTLDTQQMKTFIKTFHLRQNELFTTEDIDKVLGMTIINMKEDDHLLYNKEGIHLAQVNVEGIGLCYDVIRDTVNKGVAVKVMLEHFNIPKEKAIAFGDGLNDKEMLSLVGEGFAMGNAHPDLFQYAKNKTTDVDTSGVYNGLKSLGLVND
ncbi:Cof-type HAD-IIB family hydrolase [Cytobacillus sp. FJAT-54145]|uniref:Cof-type HAD-IIB family hydrolase n=1 Tax=Cytobacillus spartinae TaxID=3299023 RepID=A0ABW6KIU6_9BACI